MPSSLETLLEYIERYPPPAPIRPSLVVVYAETLLPPIRRRLQLAFGAPVIDEYGLTECGGMVAQECAKQDGFHVLPLDYYVEVVDASGTPVPDGTEGLVVITNLYSSLVPIVRYCTEDYAVLTHQTCTCGSPIPRLQRLTGRALTRFVRPDGTRFNPFEALGTYLLRLPVAQFQLAQQPGHRFVLRYRADGDISTLDDAQALRATLQQTYGRRADIAFEKVDSFASDVKFQAFVCEETSTLT
jgi:phenylacetate-CoA ligase